MKITVFILLILATLGSKAQEAQPQYKGLIKLYPLNAAVGHYNAGYEYIINKQYALELNTSLYEWDLIYFFDEYNEVKQLDVDGFAFRLNFKYYPKKKAPFGFYYSPQIMFKHTVSEPTEVNFQTSKDSIIRYENMYALKYLIGIQKHIFSRVVVDLYTGFGVRHFVVKQDYFYSTERDTDTGNFIEQRPIGKVNSAIFPYIHNLSVHAGLSICIAI